MHYHGDLLRADDENGTRFRFINDEKFDLDLSFGGSFPTDTGNNDARAGMPNLDWTAEIGPRLIYYIYRNPEVAQLRIGIPVRSSFATDFLKWYGVGYVFAPTIQLDKYNFLTEKLDLFLHYTAHFTSEGVADFFYRVTEPIFRRVRNRLPNFGPVDLAPLVILLLLGACWYLLRGVQNHMILGGYYF